MKKIVAGVFASSMLAAGLVGGSTGSAVAAEPYPGSVKTFTQVSAPDELDRGDRARICVKVTSNGNGRPEGKVTIRVIRSKGGFKFVDLEKYDGGKVCFRTPKLKMRGNYIVKAIFDRKAGSVWKDSDNRTEFRVVRG